jgi:hypothetical protein
MASVVTTVGKGIITNRIKGAGTEPLYTAWGTGAGTAVVGDTTLNTETGTRVSGTSTQQTTSVTNDTYQVVGTMTAGGALAITNAGLFDAATVGGLFVHADFTTINLASGDSIQFTFKVQFT